VGRQIGKLIGTLRGHEHEVTSAAFSPDGRRIVASSWDRTAQIWEISLNIEEFVAHAKSVAPRALSVAQRTTFFLDPEPPPHAMNSEMLRIISASL